MVDKFDRLRKSEQGESISRSGVIRVVMDVPIEAKKYDGTELTDTDIGNATIEAIQEGKGRIIKMN